MAFAKIKPVPEENSMNAVIYARYSSSNQTENSIDGQLRECGKYAEMRGYTVIKTYIDRAKSGTSVDDRTEFLHMIDDAKKQQFAFVIVYRFDRFTRNRYDSVIYKKQLSAVGVRVISSSENVGDGDEAIILESIYEAMDEAYSRRLSTITKRGLNECARKGLWTRPAPFGYRLENQKLIVNPREAEGVRYIFNEYLNGRTKTQIADGLNEMGYRTHKGNAFAADKITVLMSNRVYAGHGCYNGIEFPVPAIIDEELFEKVTDKERANRKIRGKKVEKAFYALTGKLFCGMCGSAMTGDSGTSRNGTIHNYYTCDARKKRHSCKKKSERQDFLEWYICEQTLKFVLTPERIKETAEKVAKLAEEDQKNNGLNDALKRQKEIDREFEKLTDKLINTDSPAVIKRINERAHALEKELEAVEKEIAQCRLAADHVIKKEDIERYLTALRGGDPLDADFRLRIINTFIKCIYLFDDKMVVYFNLNATKQISYIDMLQDVGQLADDLPKSCSDCKVSGELLTVQLEHILFVFKKNYFGAVIKIRRD